MDEKNILIRKIQKKSKTIIGKLKAPQVGDYFFQEDKKLKAYLSKINQAFFDIQHLFTSNEIKCDNIKLLYQYYSKFHMSIIEELITQNLTLDNFNKKRKKEDSNHSYGFMLYSNQKFLDKTYLLIDDYVKKMQLTIDDALLEFKIGNIQQNDSRITNNYKRLSGKLINILSLNSDAYIEMFSIENYIRAYILLKYKDQFHNDSLTEFFKNSTKIEKKAISRKQEDEKNGWLEPRGKTLLSYLDFDELKTLIINNWASFENDFPEQDFIRIRFNELYQVRNKIAHNSNIAQQEFDMLKMYSIQICDQLKKYNDEIKIIEL